MNSKASFLKYNLIHAIKSSVIYAICVKLIFKTFWFYRLCRIIKDSMIYTLYCLAQRFPIFLSVRVPLDTFMIDTRTTFYMKTN